MGDPWEALAYRLFCRLIGIATPVSSTESDDIVENWNSLALISAILTSISGGGLFAAAEYVNTARDAMDIADAGSNNTITASNRAGDNMKFMVAKWTMTIFCNDTFCFLNSTVITTFFVAFINRHTEHSTKQIYALLGSAHGIGEVS